MIDLSLRSACTVADSTGLPLSSTVPVIALDRVTGCAAIAALARAAASCAAALKSSGIGTGVHVPSMDTCRLSTSNAASSIVVHASSDFTSALGNFKTSVSGRSALMKARCEISDLRADQTRTLAFFLTSTEAFCASVSEPRSIPNTAQP